MEFTAENVKSAVEQFYSSSGGIQAQLHQWLMSAQTSKEAWSFVWPLLLREVASPEVQFFGATTLQAKVAKFWTEVPPEEMVGLRKRLLETLLLHKTNKLILNRLCISMALCALQSMPKAWEDPVSDILDTLQPSSIPNVSPEGLASILLAIMTVLPEEFQTMHMAQGRKGEVRHKLHESSSKVLATIGQCLSIDTLCLKAVNCFKSWVQFGLELPEVEPIADLVYQVVEKKLLVDLELGEAALDALMAVGTQPESNKYPTVLLKMTEKWLRLHQITKQQQPRNIEVESGVLRLLVMVAENHSNLILNALLPPELGGLSVDQACRDTAAQLVKTALDCSSMPGYFPVHETCSEVTFSFWYLLQDNMTNLSSDAYAAIKRDLVPVYCSLTDTLLAKSVLPEDLDSWSAEDQESLRCYRQDVADTMMYCHNVLDDEMLRLLHCHLCHALDRCSTDKNQWRPLEACLHAFYAVSEAVNYEENLYMPQVFISLKRIPDGCHPKLISSALDLIGSYAEWINQHPDVLHQVVPILVTGLRAQEYATSATMALKDLTRDCQVSLQPFAEMILQAAKEALDSGRLQHNESIRLMYPLGKVLSCLPTAAVVQQLQIIVIPYLEELQQLLLLQQPPPETKLNIILRIKMFSMLFATLEPRSDNTTGSGEQPIVMVLHSLMPVFERVSQIWGRDPAVVDAMCSALKFSVQNLLDDCRPLLNPLLSLLLNIFKRNPQPPALDLAQLFLVLFGNDESQQMQMLLAELVSLSLQFCSSNMAEHTDLVQSLLQVLSQVLKKSPRLFLSPDLNLQLLFHFATVSIGMAENCTVKAAVSFLSSFIAQSREMEPLQAVVNAQGEDLVRKIFACIGGESTRTVAELMSDLLLALNKKYFDNQTRWMNHLMAIEGFPSTKVDPETKQKFAKLILKERANKRKMQEHVREFSLACRGMLGSDYAQVSPYF